MKLWVVLVAAALLAGCGADPGIPDDDPSPTLDPSPSPTPDDDDPSPTPGPSPTPIWGNWGGWAQNVSERLRKVPLLHRLRSAVQELLSQAERLRRAVREEAGEVRGRAGQYGAEARAVLEQSLWELRGRGASYARKLRRRLLRDGEELRRRWEQLARGWDGAAAAVGSSFWGDPREEEEEGDPQ